MTVGLAVGLVKMDDVFSDKSGSPFLTLKRCYLVQKQPIPTSPDNSWMRLKAPVIICLHHQSVEVPFFFGGEIRQRDRRCDALFENAVGQEFYPFGSARARSRM